MNSAKVVIIGAGSSGIAAATKLLELGFQQVTILEAEDRIGGRINTISFADNIVEVGAQYCHGAKGNVVFELASKLNLLKADFDENSIHKFFRSNKEEVSSSVTDRIFSIIGDLMSIPSLMRSKHSGSLGAYIVEKFNEALDKPEYSDINKTLAQELLQNYQGMGSTSAGADTLDDVSRKGFLDYWQCEGELLWIWKDKGYIELLRLLMKARELNTDLGMLEERVRFGKSVKRIIWSAAGVKIHCEDSEVIEADHAIVTVSLGVLKEKHLTLFEPMLPVEKVHAIESIGFGTMNKIFIEFPAKFWADNWGGLNLLWRKEDLIDIRGTNRAWLEGVFGFYPVHRQPKVLGAAVFGKSARHMETLPEEEVIGGCMYLLRKFLQFDIPSHVSAVISRWHKNANFRGGHSYRSMSAEELNKKPCDLAIPLESSDHKPIVLFAGEATSDHHFATVHGAVETGWREAERLAKFYERKSKEESIAA